MPHNHSSGLNYDDYAFMHFLNALCILAIVYLLISIVMIIRTTLKDAKRNNELRRYEYLRDKIK